MTWAKDIVPEINKAANKLEFLQSIVTDFPTPSNDFNVVIGEATLVPNVPDLVNVPITISSKIPGSKSPTTTNFIISGLNDFGI